MDPRDDGLDDRAGLCASCLHANVIESSRGSVFYLCRLSLTDPKFPRYPRLPVLACRGYSPEEERQAGDQ